MKKTILIVAQLIILALGVLWYTKYYRGSSETNQNAGTSQTATGGESSLQASASASASPSPSMGGGSLLSSLDEQVLLVAGMSPRNVEPVLQYAKQKYSAITELKAVKQLNLEKQLLEKFESGFGASDTPERAKEKYQEFLDGLQVASRWWAGINSNLLVVSAKTFDAGKGLKLPYLLINVALNNPALADELSKKLETVIPGGNLELPDAKVIKVTNGYKLALNAEGYAVTAKLNIEAQRLQLILGSEDETVFRAAAGAPLLRDTALWKSTSHALVPSSAAFAFIDNRKLQSLLQALVQAIPEDKRGEAKVFVDSIAQSWKPMDGMFFSHAVGQRPGYPIDAKSCVVLSADSPLKQITRDYLAAKAQAGSSDYPKLLTKRTILSLGVNLSGIDKWFKPVVDTVISQIGQSEPMFGQMLSPYLTLIEGHLNQLQPSEVSLTVNAPMGMPIPDGMIVLKSSKIQGSDFTQAIQKIVADIGQNIGDPSIAPEVVPGDNGVSTLRFSAGAPGMNITGVPLGNKHFAFLMNEALAPEVDTKLKASNDELGTVLNISADKLGEIRSSDGVMYFNSEAVTELAKPFLPMLLPGLNAQLEQQGGQPLSLDDIETALKQINGALVTTYHTEQPEESTVCRSSSLIFAEVNAS